MRMPAWRAPLPTAAQRNKPPCHKRPHTQRSKMGVLAEGVLKLHWDGNIPVNLARLAKAMQLRVAFESLPPEVCARLEITAQRKQRVCLDRSHSLVRQRYGVAHALGHIALHHLRPGMQCRIRVSENYHVDLRQRPNSEANDFALRLLMPADALREHLQQWQEKQIYTMQALAEAFEVAPIMLKQRMADLDLTWPKTLAQQLRPEVLWEDDNNDKLY